MWGRDRKVGAIFLFFAANVLVCSLLYAWYAGSLVARVIPHASSRDFGLFCAYCVALLGGSGLAAAALFCGVARLSWPRGVLVATALPLALVVVAIVLDCRAYLWLGLHLYDPVVWETLRQPDARSVLHVGFREMAAIGSGLTLTTAAELALAWGCALFYDRRQPPARRRLLTTTLGLATLLVALSTWSASGVLRPGRQVTSQLVSILPLHEVLFRRATERVVQYEMPPLHYPQTAIRAPVMGKKPDVLFLLAESLRADAANPQLMPSLSRFLHDSDCIRPRHHYAGSHQTHAGLFSLLYGLNSYYYEGFLNENKSSYPIDVLKRNGYQTIGSCGTELSKWFYASFETDQFDTYREFSGGESYERDAKVADAAVDLYAKRDRSRPFFMFLFFDSTHYGYSYPPGVEPFQPAFPENKNQAFADDSAAETRLQVRNRYANAVHYVDSLLGRVLEAVADDWRQGNLVIVASGDHGEDMWEDGTWGHTSVRFGNGRTEVPFALCLPPGSGREVPDVPLSVHADVFPTLLDYAELSPPVDPSTYSDGVSLLAPPSPDRQVVVSSAWLLVHDRELALVTAANKFWLARENAPAGGDEYRVLRETDAADRALDPGEVERVAPELSRRLQLLDGQFGRFFRR